MTVDIGGLPSWRCVVPVASILPRPALPTTTRDDTALPEFRLQRDAHNLVLEVMADTGSVGIIGLLVGCVLVIRLWLGMTPAGRIESFPFVLSMTIASIASRTCLLLVFFVFIAVPCLPSR